MKELFPLIKALNQKITDETVYINMQTFPSSAFLHIETHRDINYRFNFSRGDTKHTCTVSYLPPEGTDAYGSHLEKIQEILFLAFGQHDEIVKNQHGEPVFVWRQ